MKETHVCILTAGTGRRTGPFADIVNKCLLPYKGWAIISHIIDLFPINTTFVIGLGYKGDQVKTYLTLMHPKRLFHFVEVDRYTGPGTGPGYSLQCCRPLLPGAFYFVAGDGIFEAIPTEQSYNWVAVSFPNNTQDLTPYCNIGFDQHSHKALSIYDKMAPPSDIDSGIFTGLMFIKDSETFWTSLEHSKASTNEVQIAQGLNDLIANGQLYCKQARWQDLGTFDLYQAAQSEAFDFSKTEEFIYFSDTRVIKFFANETIACKRVEKAAIKPDLFPSIIAHENQFYAYEMAPGNTVYERLNVALFSKLLHWLKQELWQPQQVSEEKMNSLCQSFYIDKTLQRLKLYQEKYPHTPEATHINGETVLPIDQLLSKLPADIVNGVPVFMHGDLQFDNILTSEHGFTLIDWRQDFAGEVAYGDWYYDLAKLLGGIYLNYDYVKLGLMSFEQHHTEVLMDYAVRQQADVYASMLQTFVENERLDFNRVQILRGLIYLNMSPLHHPPFDRMLYALAQVILTKMLT